MIQRELLTIENLQIGFCRGKQTIPIASNLSASLSEGSLTSLIGLNGVGKSTLLRTLAGLQKSLKGKVRYAGKEIQMYTPTELSKLITIVLTARVEADYLCVRQVVEMGRVPYTSLWGRLSKYDRDRVDEALVLTRTDSLADKDINSLSDGERARVMVAKALVQDTPIILLDEPTAFLDFSAKVEMMQLLASLAHDKGRTILLSIHDLELAFRMSDQLWLLAQDGLCQGDPKTLAEEGFLSKYFDAPGIRLDVESLRFSYEK